LSDSSIDSSFVSSAPTTGFQARLLRLERGQSLFDRERLRRHVVALLVVFGELLVQLLGALLHVLQVLAVLDVLLLKVGKRRRRRSQVGAQRRERRGVLRVLRLERLDRLGVLVVPAFLLLQPQTQGLTLGGDALQLRARIRAAPLQQQRLGRRDLALLGHERLRLSLGAAERVALLLHQLQAVDLPPPLVVERL
jgi:hypothetical protein